MMHNNGKGQHGDMRHDNGDRRQHGDERHDDADKRWRFSQRGGTTKATHGELLRKDIVF
jgi:hypothetical protein